jgi:hypothetical protein
MFLLVRRAARWLGVDRNPLRRGTDRIESAVRIAFLLAFLICGPMLAGVAGAATHASSVHQVAADRSWRRVNAVLLASSPRQFSGYSPMLTTWVRGRWRTPAGLARTGLVPVPAGSKAGSVVGIWVDRSGWATGHPPMTADLVGYRVAFAEIGAMAALAVGLLLLGCVVRWYLNRRRMARWALEWAYIGPRWTTRR